MTVLDWLLESDPAIRWQVLRDLVDAPPELQPRLLIPFSDRPHIQQQEARSVDPRERVWQAQAPCREQQQEQRQRPGTGRPQTWDPDSGGPGSMGSIAHARHAGRLGRRSPSRGDRIPISTS